MIDDNQPTASVTTSEHIETTLAEAADTTLTTVEVSTQSPVKTSKQSLITWLIVGLVTLGGGGFAAYTVWGGQRTITTGNARITTDLIHITATLPGLLERFDLYDGMKVYEGQVLGWLQQGETFRSPIDGIIVNTTASLGEHILPLVPLATIADLNNLHIQANLYESDIRYIQLGQPVSLTLDGLGNQTLAGYVRHISPISEQELAGVPTLVNTGTFRRITQTLPVEINLLGDWDVSHLIGTNARVSFPVLPVGDSLMSLTPNNGFNSAIIATGRVESTDIRHVYTPHTLRIEEVLVSRGDTVTPGQVLATLDVADLESSIAVQQAAMEQARTHSQLQAQETQRMLHTAQSHLLNDTNIHRINAQAAVTAARLQLDSAQRLYDQARQDATHGTDPMVLAASSALNSLTLELDRLQTDYHHVSTLYTAGALPRREFDNVATALTHLRNQHADAAVNDTNAREAQARTLEQLTTALATAQTTYNLAVEVEHATSQATHQEIEGLQSALRLSQVSTVDHLEHSLVQLQRHLAEGVITAPVAGTLTAVHAEAGQFSLSRLFSIENLDAVRILATVREYDLPNITLGQPVTATAYATGTHVHHGTITGISPRAISTHPVVQFEIEVAVTDTDHGLRPGMSARVRVE